MAKTSPAVSEHESVHYGSSHPAKVTDTPHLADDDPEIWGWHHDFGKSMRITGWVVAAIMLVMMLGNHEGNVENLWLITVALVMVIFLVYDLATRRKSWRK